ncbi:hypothetical protein COY33_01150, partial [candidate division WWE3 bacterium CG_4_10_14_0_2_um_filter_42_7]
TASGAFKADSDIGVFPTGVGDSKEEIALRSLAVVTIGCSEVTRPSSLGNLTSDSGGVTVSCFLEKKAGIEIV